MAEREQTWIDQHIPLAELEVCVCGSNTFKTLRTNAKVIQGILFQRNNIAYHGREKQCTNCGKRYKSILPESIGDFQTMQSEVAACVRKRNSDTCRINWQFTREKAKEKFKLS